MYVHCRRPALSFPQLWSATEENYDLTEHSIRFNTRLYQQFNLNLRKGRVTYILILTVNCGCAWIGKGIYCIACTVTLSSVFGNSIWICVQYYSIKSVYCCCYSASVLDSSFQLKWKSKHSDVKLYYFMFVCHTKKICLRRLLWEWVESSRLWTYLQM